MTVEPVGEPLPHQPGERHTLTITDLAFGGDGVGRIGEFVVFVPFVIPGERVDVELVDVKRQFARARLLAVVEASPHRVWARCPHFGECGGCQYQHLEYREQLRVKHKQVADLLERVGGFPPEVVQPVVACPQPYGYRNRIMIRSQWHKPEQRLVMGFLRHDNRLVVDLDECAIAEPGLNAEIRRVRANPPPKGGIKVSLRILPDDWEVPPDSFFQNNYFLLPQLVETVQARLAAAGVRHLVDVYCGVGFFGLSLAAGLDSVIGLECDAPAIRAARRNAERRGVPNATFVAGTAEDRLPGLLANLDSAQTAVILDPPRVGCQRSVIECLRSVRPAQLLYVSCHPATLARDLKLLCGDGVFRLERLDPLDMFPQTQHVECVADLRVGSPRPPRSDA